MPDRHYRSNWYANYVRVQKPDWNEPAARVDAITIQSTLRRLRGLLPLDQKAKCLDLGSGSGLLLETLRAAGYSDLRGVDLCGEAVEIVRNKGFAVAQGDLCSFLRESNERFDLITAFDVVEHFGKDEIIDVLTLIGDHLSPGGRLILQTPNALSPWASSFRYGDLTHEWIFDPHCIASVLDLVGFRSVRIFEITPYVHGLKSALRWVLWRFIWGGCALWNMAETGSAQGGVYTRNMIVAAFRTVEP